MNKISSHTAWRLRRELVGKSASWSGYDFKEIREVIVSPNHNAYAVVYVDGTMDDMSTYDSIYIGD